MSGSQAARMAKSAAAPAVANEPAPAPPTAETFREQTETVRQHRLFLAAWYTLNLVLVGAVLATIYSVAWEYSTRRYLKGFSDAIIPLTAPPEEKIQSILNWMSHGPGRQVKDLAIPEVDRDPTDTLNYDSLLKVCGTATNAFINLADSAGLASRRLLLLDSKRATVHVVAETLINGRWIIVDPAFRVILRGSDGRLLTAQDLADRRVFAAATQAIPKYDSTYTFDRTVHVRLSAVRYIGLPMRAVLDRLLPGWEDSTTTSLLLERRSLADMVIALIVVFILFLLRTGLRWYGEQRMGLRAARIRTQAWRAISAFLDTAS